MIILEKSYINVEQLQRAEAASINLYLFVLWQEMRQK